MVNLNSFLIPVGSPIEENQTQVQSGYDWNASNERGAIAAQFIKSLSFSQAQGGTAVLGGNGNGNGVVIVKNASGGTVAQLDYSGLTINNGSITINNNSGSPVVDAYGVNSQNVFVNAAAINSGTSQIISGTVETPLKGGTLTFISNRNNINYVFMWQAECFLIEPGTNSANAFIRLRIDGTNADPGINLFTGNNINRSYMAHQLRSLSAGTHTAILYGAMYGLSGTATFSLLTSKFTYFALGQ
jgi:hypothetical protein